MSTLLKTKKYVVTEFRTAGILEAARRTFAKKGFHEATMDDIANAAGVAKGTVYLYYRSKQDVYIAALKFGIAQMYAALVDELKRVSTTEEKLRALIAAKLAYFDENRDFFRIYYSELGQIPIHPAAIDSEFKALYLEQARFVEAILKVENAEWACLTFEGVTGCQSIALLEILIAPRAAARFSTIS